MRCLTRFVQCLVVALLLHAQASFGYELPTGSGARPEAESHLRLRPNVLVGPHTWNVATDGDDNNPGTPTLPLATIQKAVDVAAAGDTVILADGTYRGSGNRDIVFRGDNLTIRSAAGVPENCIIDCEGTAGAPHHAFWFHDHEDTTTVIRGLTITGAYVIAPAFGAIMCGNGASLPGIPGYFNAAAKLDNVHVVDNNGNGIAAQGSLTSYFVVRNCRASRNTGSGYALHCQDFVVKVSNSTFRDNDVYGMKISGAAGLGLGLIERCTFVANRYGVDVARGLPEGATRFESCRADSNLVSGFNVVSGAAATFNYCSASWNSGNGVSVGSIDQIVSSFVGGSYSYNTGWGIVSTPISGLVTAISGSEVRGNGSGGVQTFGQRNLYVDNSLIVDNGGVGIVLSASGAPGATAEFACANATVANNVGAGMVVACGSMPLQVDLDRLAVTGNGGVAVDLAAAACATLDVSCSNLQGNAGGDWIGVLAPMLGADGNSDRIPLYCDATGGNYDLQDNSPLAAADNPCGRVGYPGGECPAPVMSCRELHDYASDGNCTCDATWFNIVVTVEGVVTVPQGRFSSTSGGYLSDGSGGINFWRLPTDTVLQPGDRVRMSGRLWPDGGEMFYLGDYTYEVLQTGPNRNPRRVAVSALLDDRTNACDFVLVLGNVTAMGADAFWLDDGTGQIEVRRNAHGGVDFSGLQVGGLVAVASVAFKEGCTLHLKPVTQGDIILNPASGVGTDINGPAPGSLPHSLKVYPCQPNPFNPSTAIRFDLPTAGPVRLAVYDLAGRLVRTLVDESRAQGSHAIVWNGRDTAGREVASGSYLARLDFGGKVEMVRMGLVR